MKTVRSVTAAAVAAAMLATSVTPAMAQSYPGGGYGYPGGGYGRGHHRDHDRIGAGGIIAGIAVLGVIAAIASSGSKNRNRGGGYDDGYQGGYRGGINSEGAAADACAGAVEQQGGYRVTGIDTVDRTRDGYTVRGTLNTRSGGSWGYGRNQQQGFTCAVRDGAIADVRIDNGYNGSRGY